MIAHKVKQLISSVLRVGLHGVDSFGKSSVRQLKHAWQLVAL